MTVEDMVVRSSLWVKNKKTANIEWRTRIRTRWKTASESKQNSDLIRIAGTQWGKKTGNRLFELFGQFISI